MEQLFQSQHLLVSDHHGQFGHSASLASSYLNAARLPVEVGGVPVQGLRQSQLRCRQLVPERVLMLSSIKKLIQVNMTPNGEYTVESGYKVTGYKVNPYLR